MSRRSTHDYKLLQQRDQQIAMLQKQIPALQDRFAGKFRRQEAQLAMYEAKIKRDGEEIAALKALVKEKEKEQVREKRREMPAIIDIDESNTQQQAVEEEVGIQSLRDLIFSDQIRVILRYDEQDWPIYVSIELLDNLPILKDQVEHILGRWKTQCREQSWDALLSKWTGIRTRVNQHHGLTPGSRCVTCMVRHRAQEWGAGCEGLFACRTCVRSRQPCLTVQVGRLVLLPLHEDDRVLPYKGEMGVHVWINV